MLTRAALAGLHAWPAFRRFPGRGEPIDELGIETGPGWFRILNELGRDLSRLGVSATRVRSSSGALDVRVGTTTPDVTGLVERAARRSTRTCEPCGEPGSVWCFSSVNRVLCADCAAPCAACGRVPVRTEPVVQMARGVRVVVPSRECPCGFVYTDHVAERIRADAGA